MSIFSLHIDAKLRDFLTMTTDHDHDRFYGKLKFQPWEKAVIVIVTSHSPEVKRHCSLILNTYLFKISLPINTITRQNSLAL